MARRSASPGVSVETMSDPLEKARETSRLLEKCHRYTRPQEVKAAGLYPYFKPISDSEDTVVTIEGEKRIMLGSNNYLGMTHHPKVLEAAENALRRFGSGCTGSRFLNGTLELHERLEAELAEFLGKESCLVFSTGYGANLGLVSGLVLRKDEVYLDKLDHASIVDGASLSMGKIDPLQPLRPGRSRPQADRPHQRRRRPYRRRRCLLDGRNDRRRSRPGSHGRQARRGAGRGRRPRGRGAGTQRRGNPRPLRLDRRGGSSSPAPSPSRWPPSGASLRPRRA